jgi:hypothetical protein
MRKRWRHNARQSGEGGLIDELLRNVMATQHLKVKLAAHHVHNIVHRAILGSVAIFMLNNITPKSSMANYHPLHYLVVCEELGFRAILAGRLGRARSGF